MCILCDLQKHGEEREVAKFHVQNIIDTCEKIQVGYRRVLSGTLKPHTDEMKHLVLLEKSLIRSIIDDVL